MEIRAHIHKIIWVKIKATTMIWTIPAFKEQNFQICTQISHMNQWTNLICSLNSSFISLSQINTWEVHNLCNKFLNSSLPRLIKVVHPQVMLPLSINISNLLEGCNLRCSKCSAEIQTSTKIWWMNSLIC